MDMASPVKEQIFSAIRAFTSATVAEAQAATTAIVRHVDNSSPKDMAMPTLHTTREASIGEIVAEMDRRGAVIESLEAERDRYLEALRDIDSVGVDFGHFEDAARTMQEMARKAMA